ncbi:hypothetical protein ACEN2J_03305 [Pseudorhodobacter sp. W20_MBD10_FR17]|uniref:hypothetical protein n=1 Tax=Pseudorhodobacter sp. W20_MBD10_FR17 TaxID=3240266 RepID=UPI003F9E6A23
MNIPAMTALAAITFGATAYATPTPRLAFYAQQQTTETAPNATETGGRDVERKVQQVGWLRLISGDDDGDHRDDDDDDDDDDENGCGNANRPCDAAPTKGPITPPKNGLFTTGQAPRVKTN